MDFEELYDRYTLSASKILELVDEYDLYCYYLDYCPDTRTAYSSPFRDDPRPSFSIFESRYFQTEYAWKDSGVNEKGDIFDLIKLLRGLGSRDDVFRLIDQDQGLGYGSSTPITERKPRKYQRPQKAACDISIQSRPFNDKDRTYWGQYGITEQTLQRFGVKALQYFWLYPAQEAPSQPRGLGYAYQIGEYYKLYQPHNRMGKFLNDYPEYYVEGYIQLAYTSKRLVITKSLKEVMWFWEHFRQDAIAGKSESTPIPEYLIKRLQERYQEIILFLDNDAAGWKAAYQYQKLYGFKITAIPKCLFRSQKGSDKDPTDVHAHWGLDQAKIVVNYCLNHEINYR